MVEFHIWSWFKFTTESFNNTYIYPILQLFKISQGVLPRIVACIPMIFASPITVPNTSPKYLWSPSSLPWFLGICLIWMEDGMIYYINHYIPMIIPLQAHWTICSKQKHQLFLFYQISPWCILSYHNVQRIILKLPVLNSNKLYSNIVYIYTHYCIMFYCIVMAINIKWSHQPLPSAKRTDHPITGWWWLEHVFYYSSELGMSSSQNYWSMGIIKLLVYMDTDT